MHDVTLEWKYEIMAVWKKGRVLDPLHVRILQHCIHDDDKPFRSDVTSIETVECMESVSSHVPVSAGMVIRSRMWRRKKK